MLNKIADKKATHERFQAFRASLGKNGEIQNKKIVGSGVRKQGEDRLRLYLNMFQAECYYLVPARAAVTSAPYVIMTRQDRRAFKLPAIWHLVGEAKHVVNNSTLLQLGFDLIGVSDLFIDLQPNKPTFETLAARALLALA